MAAKRAIARDDILDIGDYGAQRKALTPELADYKVNRRIAVGPGLPGTALPFPPATPLLLAAAFPFAKGSLRIRARLAGPARFGPRIGSPAVPGRGSGPRKAACRGDGGGPVHGFRAAWARMADPDGPSRNGPRLRQRPDPAATAGPGGWP